MSVIYMGTQEAAILWGIDVGRVRKYCRNNEKALGAEKDKRFPYSWKIPRDARPPITKQSLRGFLIDYVKWQHAHFGSTQRPSISNTEIVKTLIANQFANAISESEELVGIEITDKGWSLLLGEGKETQEVYCTAVTLNIGINNSLT